MAESFELKVHVETVRQHFNDSDDREWSNDDVLNWLAESGFKIQGQTWWAEEISLDLLDKSEYEIVRQL